MAMDTPYNYRVVKQFTWAAIIFGVIGMLGGGIIAAHATALADPLWRH